MTSPWEHDPFVMAVVLAIATAILSIEDPQLEVLTLTLVALAVASRLVHLRAPTGGLGRIGEELGAISLVAVAAMVYLLAPAPIVEVRGPILAASLVPLWWVARHPNLDRGVLA